MDRRTNNLLQDLDGLAADVLVDLLEEPSSEKDLVERIAAGSQPTIHRKLKQLQEVGLIQRPASKKRGQLWSVVAPAPTKDLLKAAVTLAKVLDAIDEQKRQAMLTRLDALDSSKPHLRIAPEGGRAGEA